MTATSLYPTAYTIGNRKSYDEAIRLEPTRIKKLGRDYSDLLNPYDGGWVWRTLDEVTAFIDAYGQWPWEPKVYGLILPTDWDTDVSPEPHESDGVHRLLNDARIVAVP